MTTTPVENLGSIFADPAAYANPERWYAAAARIRAESPILQVSEPGFPDFWAIMENWNRTLVEHAGESAGLLVRVAAAVTAAHGEETLRSGYRSAGTYQTPLGDLGYELDDGEFPIDNPANDERNTPAA